MGMTIDEAISWLVSITEHEGEDIPIYDDDVKAISIAIDTMRKYQKIEQITQEWRDSGFGRGQLYEVINGVLQDGNDD